MNFRTVRFLSAVILLAILPTSAFAFGRNKIVYDKFDWRIYQSTHFDVYFYEAERESLQKVVNFAESAYDDLSQKFNFQISKRIPLMFYATHSDFEQTNVMLNFIPEGVGAFAEPVRNRMVLPIDLPDEKILALIKHELTHIFEYEILFQGRVDRALRIRPPTWVMEGLASFMAEDEDTSDRMVLRDAVVNDSIPSVDAGFGGFFAYRFGHEVFNYMVHKYGWDGLRDFIFEYRNSLGPSVERPLKRAFDVTVEEFDSDLRLWLRKRFLPALIEKGEPQEFGEIFRTDRRVASTESSPAVSPSGDLLVALTTFKQDVDVALYNTRSRELIRVLTKGLPEKYEYIIGQFLTIGPVAGRDLAFNPNGDEVAMFVKKGQGRALMLINSISGKILEMIKMPEVEQQLNPTYSPDGRTIAFHAFQGNQADIFFYDVASGEITNVTNDRFFDVAPVFSPDGEWLVYSSVVEGYSKIFRLKVADPSKRYQMTTGDFSDIDATFSPDGKRMFYASDRLTPMTKIILPKEEEAKEPEEDDDFFDRPKPGAFAAFNIYSLNLDSGEILQFTDVVGGSTNPQVVIGEDNEEKLIFSSYYKGRNRLYITNTKEPLRVAETVTIESEPVMDRAEFLAPIEVELDPENERKGGEFKFFIEDVSINAGINSDQTFLSRSYIFLSDMLGNRRLVISLDTVSTFANFDFTYVDQTRRTGWGARLYDTNTFYVAQNQRQEIERGRRAYKETGLIGFLSYPFDVARRVEFGGGYIRREIAYPFNAINPDTGELELVFLEVKDNFPLVFAQFSGDKTHFKEFGPISGRRYNFGAQYAHDTELGGALTTDLTLDARHYMQLSQRTLLAARLFVGYSTGNLPNFYYFGGLNTLRGYDFRTIVGSEAFFANFEFRFPLVNQIDAPVLPSIRSIRGHLFFDIGGARFEDQDWQFWEDGKLRDGVASLGWGISFNFLGLELHWDFARRTDLDSIDPKTRTSFWIGQKF